MNDFRHIVLVCITLFPLMTRRVRRAVSLRQPSSCTGVGGGYDGLTWAVEVGRLDPVSRSTRAEVAVGSVDTDLPAAMVVSQTLVHCDNCKYAHVLALF